jgi:hypothetical protein
MKTLLPILTLSAGLAFAGAATANTMLANNTGLTVNKGATLTSSHSKLKLTTQTQSTQDKQVYFSKGTFTGKATYTLIFTSPGENNGKPMAASGTCNPSPGNQFELTQSQTGLDELTCY